MGGSEAEGGPDQSRAVILLNGFGLHFGDKLFDRNPGGFGESPERADSQAFRLKKLERRLACDTFIEPHPNAECVQGQALRCNRELLLILLGEARQWTFALTRLLGKAYRPDFGQPCVFWGALRNDLCGVPNFSAPLPFGNGLECGHAGGEVGYLPPECTHSRIQPQQLRMVLECGQGSTEFPGGQRAAIYCFLACQLQPNRSLPGLLPSRFRHPVGLGDVLPQLAIAQTPPISR